MTDTEAPLSTTAAFASIVPVWILAAIGATLVGILGAPEERFGGLCLTLAVSALAAFCVQLAIRRRENFVARVTTSIVGAVVVTSIASIVIALSM